MAKYYVECGDVEEVIDRRSHFEAAYDAVLQVLDANSGMIALNPFCIVTEHGWLEDDGSNVHDEDVILDTNNILIRMGMEPEF